METEKRLIDANALTDKVDESKHNNPHPQGMVRVNHRNEHDHFLRMIMDAPTVDAVEVVHGRWEKVDIVPNYMWRYRCSCCHSDGESGYRYCPNCGAKMDGDGNGTA
jgi:hypothetical protein